MRSLALSLLAALAVVSGFAVAQAQDDDPGDGPATEVFAVGEWDYDYQLRQPGILYVEEVHQTRQTTELGIMPVMRTADGDIMRLTPCDDVDVPCELVVIEARGPYRDAVLGDAFGTDPESLTAGD